MDKNTALQILGLDAQDDQRRAKIAFRSLAKAWHPDRFAADPGAIQVAERRMKQINRAFQVLKGILPETLEGVDLKTRASRCEKTGKTADGKRSDGQKTAQTGRAKTGSVFSAIGRIWSKRAGGNKIKRAGGSRDGGRPVAGKSRPAGKSRRVGSKPCDFERVLKHAASTRRSPGSFVRPGARAYDNYCRYMAVNRQVKLARTRSDRTGTGRVEKITPIRSVDPVQSSD